MAESFCGKACSSCEEKEVLHCGGCRFDPGRAYSTECSIAKCCRGTGLNACESCDSHIGCRNLQGRQSKAADRIYSRKRQAKESNDLTQKGLVMGKWLWFLFWLVIASTVLGIGLNDTVAEAVPMLRLPIAIFQTAVGIGYGCILLKLTEFADGYRGAGILRLLCALFLLAENIVDSSGFTLLISLVGVVLGFFADFREYLAHADAVEEIDPELARKWRRLWYWYLGTIGAMLLGILAGPVLLLISSISAIVVSIMKIVYLYQTARDFRYFITQIENSSEM